MTTGRILSSILGGELIAGRTRVAGEAITNEDLLDCYYRVPGAKGAISKIVKSTWQNGFTKELSISDDRFLELQQWDTWRHVFGYSILVVRGDDVQAWPPRTSGIGFHFSNFDEHGIPQTATIFYGVDDGQGIDVQRAKDGSDGFYSLRGRVGLPGPRSISTLLSLVDVLNVQNDIFTEFLAYARIHGLTHKVLKIARVDGQPLDARTHDAYYNRFKTTSRENLVIVGSGDEFSYASPMIGAYDPINLLDFGDKLISRESSLTRFHLTGDPSGHLSSSQDASANFYAEIKGEQAYILPQIRDVLARFGADEDTKFNDPEEVTMESKMGAIAAMRLALDGLVEREDLVEMINEFLGFTVGTDDALRPLKETEPETGKNDEQDDENEETTNERE